MAREEQIQLHSARLNGNIKRILCPTDLSPDCQPALRYAVSLALRYQAQLFICHCVTEALPDGGKRAKEYIKDLITPALNSATLDWQTIIVEGQASNIVVSVANQQQIDLIVMHTRKRPYQAALLGSNAEAICRTAPCPVLIIRAGQTERAEAATNAALIRRILVAYDFSEQADWAFSYGLNLAQEYQAELLLLHATPTYPESPWTAESRLQRMMRRLQYALPKEANCYCQIKPVVREGKPYREILSYAQEQQIDLICLGAHGAGNHELALFGSNTDRVLRQAPCPVLIAHPLRWSHEAVESSDALKVLVATDGSFYGDLAVRSAAKRHWPIDTKLRVISVLEPLSTLGPPTTHYQEPGDVEAALAELAASAAARLRGDDRIISWVVRKGRAAEEIVAEAVHWGANHIIIGTHSRTGMSRFLLGSVAENVALYAPCSVEIVRERLRPSNGS